MGYIAGKIAIIEDVFLEWVDLIYNNFVDNFNSSLFTTLFTYYMVTTLKKWSVYQS